MKEKIGIFGCTADPFTLAHREIVKQALEQHAVNAVVVVPTIVDWHRAGKTKWLDSTQKVSVVKALTKGLGLVYVDDTELRRREICAGNPELEDHAVKGWRFVDTLVRIMLDKSTDSQEFWPIVGSDELANFKSWFAWRDVLRLSGGIVAVVGRDGGDFDEQKFLEENPEFDGKLMAIRIDPKFADVSASAVREKYKDRTPGEYIDDARAEIKKLEAPPLETLLHTPIFDVVKGEKDDTGLEPVLVKAPDWVTIIVERGGEFLVEKQFRHGAGRDVYEFPCGMVEPGEDPLGAAIRELEEETGVRVTDRKSVVKLGETSPNPAFMTNTMHYFYVCLDHASYVQTKQKLDEHERLDFEWKDKDRFMFDLADDAHACGGSAVPAMALAAVKLYENAKNYPTGG